MIDGLTEGHSYNQCETIIPTTIMWQCIKRKRSAKGSSNDACMMFLCCFFADFFFFIKAYVVGTHLNCINKS